MQAFVSTFMNLCILWRYSARDSRMCLSVLLLSLLCFLHPPSLSQQSPSPPPRFSSCSSGIRRILPQRPLEAFGMWCVGERTNISFYCVWGRLIDYNFYQIHFHCLFQFYQTMQGTQYLAGWLIHWPLVGNFRCWKSLFLSLLGFYAALIDGWLPTFRDRLLVSSSRLKQSLLVILKQIAQFPFLNVPPTCPAVLPWISSFWTTYVYIYMYGVIP